MKKALIFGISGPDGGYLARLLLSKGYEVCGTSRDAENNPFSILSKLGIRDQIVVRSASLIDFRNVLQAITDVGPDEVYNLAGQSSVGLSFTQPMETMESIALGTLRILEVLRYLRSTARFYNAGSGECFGAVAHGLACDETSGFSPRSPYASAKAAAYWTTANYRESYGLFACSGILFNHESPLRPHRFVTRKIVSAAVRIAQGDHSPLELGNLSIWRDWGYAPEYVEAMWRMLQQDQPDDYVIATGQSHSLQEFVATTFATVGLNWQDHVRHNPLLLRPSEILYNCGNPAKAARQLGWTAQTTFAELIPRLIHAEQQGSAF